MSKYTDTEIHILNVGHGDCSIIRHASGRITMIDINNGQKFDADTATELKSAGIIRKSEYPDILLRNNLFGLRTDESVYARKGYAAELTDPVAYFKKHWPGQSIFRFVLTHPDLDHIRGLSKLSEAGIGIQNFWDTDHEIDKTGLTEADQADWDAYQRLRTGQDGTKVLNLLRDAQGTFWSQDDEGGGGDGIQILAPTKELRDAADEIEDPNAHSYVIRINAQGTIVIFGGDATGEDEAVSVLGDVYENYGGNLKCHIYKAAHHGRDSGYHLDAFKAMKPEYTLVSVGKKPDTDASSKYAYLAKSWNGKVMSTRYSGDFLIRISGAGNYTVNGESSSGRRASSRMLSQRMAAYGLVNR